jgi:hypothetical protein
LISWKWQPTGRLFSKYSGGRGLLHLFGPSTTRAAAVEESSRPPHPGTLEHVHSPVVWNLPTVNTFVFVVGDSSFTSANPPHPLLSTSATKFAKKSFELNLFLILIQFDETAQRVHFR